MTDVRLSTATSATARPKAQVAAKPASDSTAKPVIAGDRLQTQGKASSAEGVRIVQEALQFPPKPKKGEDRKPWLMDAYSRLLKAESTMRVLQNSSGDDRLDFGTYGDLRQQLWEGQHSVEKLDKDGAVKKAFFATILPPAQHLIDGLDNYPEPPADKAGKAEWLVGAKQDLARAKAADDLMGVAWFSFQSLDFGERTDSSSKIFRFEGDVRRVEYELNPPAPRPPATGRSATGRSGPAPLFANSQGASDLANSKNPVEQVIGAVALPFAVTLDVIDLITRPLLWLDSLGESK